ITPQRYPDLIGRKAERIIEEDEPFLDRDLGISMSFDVEKALPMDFGFTVRFLDYSDMLTYQPRMLEFHFTDKDLEEKYPGDDFSEQSDNPLKLVVHAPEFWDRTLVDLCTTDDYHRHGSIELIQKSINLTREIAPYFTGTPKVVVHPGAMSLDHPISDRDVLYENLDRSVNELNFEGVELLLENLPPHPWYFGGQWLTNAFMDAYEIRDFIQPLGLNMCYDTSHHKLYCNWAKVDFYDQLQVLLPYIRHLHLSDGAGLDGEGLQIGEGTIDWVRFFKTLGEYHGTMIPEIWRGHQRGGEGFLIAIQRLSNAYFEAVSESAPINI
ncbi:MAG: TIM barrel protein, partial [Anaerolineales bacterium]